MSRRYRHGRPPQRPHRAHAEAGSRGSASSPAIREPAEAASAPGPVQEPAPPRGRTAEPSRSGERNGDHAPAGTDAGIAVAPDVVPLAGTGAPPEATGAWHAPDDRRRSGHETPPAGAAAGDAARPGGPSPALDLLDATPGPTCTAAQLRRFIKSRPWVPMHELRRRFGINGSEDDVAALDVDGHRVFVGLPAREAGLVGELVRAGDVGVELSLDPGCPMVIGVYPMRPISRS